MGALFEGSVKWSKQKPSDDGRLTHVAKLKLGHPNPGMIAELIENWTDSGGRFAVEMKTGKDEAGTSLDATIESSEQKPGDEGDPALLVKLDFGVLDLNDFVEFFRPWYAGDDEMVWFSFEPIQRDLFEEEDAPESEPEPEKQPAAAAG